MTMRTPLGRVRGLGSAKSGTQDHWRMLLTSIASVPLTIAVMVIGFMLLGRNHAAVVRILGSPAVAILMVLFIVTTAYHMKLGMQMIIEDYVHDPRPKAALLIANIFFSFAVAASAIYAVLKLSFGV